MFPGSKLPHSLSSMSIPTKLSQVKTDYIIHRADIVGTEFMNAMCGGVNPYKILENNCLDLYKACHTYFMGTGKSYVMNYYDFQTLFICCIHLLTHSYYIYIFRWYNLVG